MIILFIILGLSLLIFAHEAGHFFVAKKMGMRVDEFGFGFPPRMFAKKIGETEYSVNWLPFGGFVKIAGEHDSVMEGLADGEIKSEVDRKRFFSSQSALRRSLVILAGVVVNFLLGWLLLSIIFMVGTPTQVVITGIEEGSPAAIQGIREGDVIRGFSSAKDFIAFVNDNRGKEIALTFLREGGETSFRITPRAVIEEGKGGLGVYLAEGGVERTGFFAAIWNGLRTSVDMFLLTFTSFWTLIKTLVLHGALLPGVVGPVGIVGVAQTSVQLGFIYFIQLLAVISINLAAMNLVPFPALDGGRFFMILIEKIKGSPISKRTESLANGIGFLLLILLMIVITIRDVGRL